MSKLLIKFFKFTKISFTLKKDRYAKKTIEIDQR